MSSTPPLQCLFCKQLNPADAIFCNECGTQLNLKPCKRCGARDDRAAEKCSKCGALFILPAQPAPEPSLGPAILGKVLDSSILSAPSQAGTLPIRLADGPPGLKWAAGTGSSETDANATRSNRRWLVAISVLLLALAIDMVFVYFYYREPEQLAQTGGEKTEVVKQPVPEVSVAPKVATRTQIPEKVSSRASPKSVADLAVYPLPAITAPVRNRQESPLIRECSQAVETLGLCNVPTSE